MGLSANLLKLKLRTQLCENRRLIVSNDIQAAALQRAVQRERGQHNCAARIHFDFQHFAGVWSEYLAGKPQVCLQPRQLSLFVRDPGQQVRGLRVLNIRSDAAM